MEALNRIAWSWWEWMGQMMWQAGVLILLVVVVDLLIRRWAWPQVRYAVWLLVLLKLGARCAPGEAWRRGKR